MRVLFAAPERLWDEWSKALRDAMPEIDLRQTGPAEEFEAIIFSPGGEIEDLSPYVNARLVQSLWAGVERIVTNPTLTQPLARMVDPSLTQGMAEYCTGWTMRAHLEMNGFAQDGEWRGLALPPLAMDRPVAILGMGELGRATARMLGDIGFPVTGVSRSGKQIPRVEVVAMAALDEVLSRAEIVICLLPETAETLNFLNSQRLSILPKGAWIINPGRGTAIDDDALLAALDTGQVGHAVLDVFRTEPLPKDHRFWAHAGVTVTPHIAAGTRASTGAAVVAENLRRANSGKDILHLVDRLQGY